MFVILAGNPLDGFEVYGPFSTAAEAHGFAESNDQYDLTSYWVTKLVRKE